MSDFNNKLLWFICLAGLYVTWVCIEQTYLKQPLYEISIKHIIYFRREFGSNFLLQKFFSLVSLAGDKAGLAACMGLSVLMLDQVHAFIVN